MKKIIIAVCIVAALLTGVFIGSSQLLKSTIVVKSDNTENMSLQPIVATPSQKTDVGTRVNINTADAKELCGLPGIGEVLALRIIEYREKNGDFQSIEEIMAVKGIGAGKYDAIREYIKIK